MEEQVTSLEAQVKELEAKLKSSQDSVIELEEWVGDPEAEITKDKYSTLLEERFAEGTAMSLR